VILSDRRESKDLHLLLWIVILSDRRESKDLHLLLWIVILSDRRESKDLHLLLALPHPPNFSTALCSRARLQSCRIRHKIKKGFGP
ncbi:MAG: hypothetical protein WBD67_13790, partial [Terracidiphilus sp.]